MIIKELFEGPVGDYCIARNTIKCLFCTEMEAYRPEVIIKPEPVEVQVPVKPEVPQAPVMSEAQIAAERNMVRRNIMI